MLLLVAIVIAALVVVAPGLGIRERLAELICQIGGGDCVERQSPAEPCVISTSSRNAELNVQALIVDIGGGGTYLREDRSDGTGVFTISDRSSLAAALRVGARGRIGNVGVEASAEASAGGELEGALQYTVPTDDADDLEDALRRQEALDSSFETGSRAGRPAWRSTSSTISSSAKTSRRCRSRRRSTWM